jgi:hypothetical protein
LVFFNLKQASYADGYYPDPRSVSRNVTATKSTTAPAVASPVAAASATRNVPTTKATTPPTFTSPAAAFATAPTTSPTAAQLQNEWETFNPTTGRVLGEDPHREYEINQTRPPQARGPGHDGGGRGGGGRTDGGRGSNGRDAGGRVQYPRGLVQGTNRHSFNASRINRNRAYPWRLISFGPATAESRDLQSNLFKPSSLGAIVPHNNATDLHAVDVATGAALIAGDFDDDEGNEVPIISLFSVLVESTIGQSLINNLQVNRVSSMGDMFRHDFGGGNIDNAQGRDFAESIVSTSPVSVMGHAKMLSGDVIATFNKLGQKEIINRDGQCVINTGYYSGHLEYRGSAGNQLCWIVFGLSLPRNYLHSDQHANHLAGHDALRHLNAAVSGDCRHPTIKCRLYGPYAHIFCRMMEAPIVASARAYHFEPVFFFKNMLLRRNSFENQFELYSCNRGARSSINLVGLSRKAADSPMEFLALKGKNDALATVRG